MISEFLSASIIKYGCVGLSGMIIDFSATWLLKEKMQVHQYVANSVGFMLAVVNNYLLNKYWTFSSTPSHSSQFLFFLIVALVGLLINNLSLHFLLKKYKYNFYFLKVIVVLIVFMWNFALNSLVTFKQS